MKKKLAIVIAVIVILGAGAAAYYVYSQNQPATQEASLDGASEPSTAPGSTNSEPDQKREAGLTSLQKGEYDQAISSLKEARAGYEAAGNEEGVFDADLHIKNAETAKKQTEQRQTLPSSGE